MKWHASLSQSHLVERAGRDSVQNGHLRMILIILSSFINSHDFFHVLWSATLTRNSVNYWTECLTLKAWTEWKWTIVKLLLHWKLFYPWPCFAISPQLGFDSCSHLYSVPTLSPDHSQLAPLLNNHSFHLQFPATHAPPCFIKPSHPSQKHPHKRTTLLFVCLKTRGTLSHFLFTSGHLHDGPLPI